MKLWATLFAIQIILGGVKRRFFPLPEEIGVTPRLKYLAVFSCAAIGFASFLFVTRLSGALVLSGLAGTAVVLTVANWSGRRSDWWSEMLLELTIFTAAVFIYLLVPGAGFYGAWLFATFAIGVVALAAMVCAILANRRDRRMAD